MLWNRVRTSNPLRLDVKQNMQYEDCVDGVEVFFLLHMQSGGGEGLKGKWWCGVFSNGRNRQIGYKGQYYFVRYRHYGTIATGWGLHHNTRL